MNTLRFSRHAARRLTLLAWCLGCLSVACGGDVTGHSPASFDAGSTIRDSAVEPVSSDGSATPQQDEASNDDFDADAALPDDGGEGPGAWLCTFPLTFLPMDGGTPVTCVLDQAYKPISDLCPRPDATTTQIGYDIVKDTFDGGSAVVDTPACVGGDLARLLTYRYCDNDAATCSWPPQTYAEYGQYLNSTRFLINSQGYPLDNSGAPIVPAKYPCLSDTTVQQLCGWIAGGR